MIRSIEDVLTQLDPVNHSEENIAELRIWAESIIEECAGNFEVNMCENDLPPEEYKGYKDKDGKEVYPVLIRESILNIKNQIK